MKMQNGSSHIYFTKTMPESGSHILVLQPECDIIMSAKEKQATTVMHQRCMMQTRSIAAGDYAWTEVQAEKIKECEARLTAKLAGFSSLKKEGNTEFKHRIKNIP